MNSTALEAGPQDFLFGEEYAAIYWLEQNGYNVSYISGIDAATNAALLLNTNAYIDVGHDEYWSQSQYANVKAAADAGVDLAFLSGNQIYWDIELAPSFDASHTANRTVVEYKDIWSGTQLDPNGTSKRRSGSVSRPCLWTRNSRKFALRNDLHGGRYRLARQHFHPRQHVATPLLEKHQHCQRQRRHADPSARLRVGQRSRQWLPASRTDRSVVDNEKRQHAAPRQRGDNRSRHGNAQPYTLPRHDERSPGLWRRHGHVVVGIVEPVRSLSWPHGAGQRGRAAVHGQPVR